MPAVCACVCACVPVYIVSIIHTFFLLFSDVENLVNTLKQTINNISLRLSAVGALLPSYQA